MPTKTPRRTFLKSTLALSGTGLSLPMLAACAAPEQQDGSITVRELYEMCVDSERNNENPTLLEMMIKDGVQNTLDAKNITLKCDVNTVEDLLGKHKNAQANLNSLKNAIKKNKWGLRRASDPEVWESACPWQDCPP